MNLTFQNIFHQSTIWWGWYAARILICRFMPYFHLLPSASWPSLAASYIGFILCPYLYHSWFSISFCLLLVSWQRAFGSYRLALYNFACFASRLLIRIMSAKRETYDFIKIGLDGPGDKESREKNNSIDPLLVQQMVPGCEEKSKQATNFPFAELLIYIVIATQLYSYSSSCSPSYPRAPSTGIQETFHMPHPSNC